MRHPVRSALAAIVLLFTAAAGVQASQLSEFYAEYPELRSTPSAGWKPWQRSLAFNETRTSDAPPALLRRDAWQAKARLERSVPRSTGSWFQTGPLGLSGRCTSIAFHPTDAATVYVGTAGGGLWKSTDGGDTWTPLTDDFPSMAIGAVAVLPSDPNTILIGGGEGNGVGYAGSSWDVFGAGMFKSTDAGATWNTTSLSYSATAGHGFGAIAVNPATGTVLAAAIDGLWRSTDDGDTWTQTVTQGNIHDVKYKPGDPAQVYIAQGQDPFVNFGLVNGVRVSTDDGLTFAAPAPGQPAGNLIGHSKIAVSAADPAVVYATYHQAGVGSVLGVWRSTDSGATWSVRDNTTSFAGTQAWYDLALTASPDNAQELILGGVPYWRSSDGGLTFTAGISNNGTSVTPHVDVHAIVHEPGSNTNVWMATDGGVWRSTNRGVTWNSRREGIVSYQFYDICVAQTDPWFMMGGLQDSGVPRRTGETTWFTPILTGDGGPCNVSPTNGNVVYATRLGGGVAGDHQKSVNGGQSFTPINTGLTGTGYFLTAQAEDPNQGNHLYTSTQAGVFRTTAGGNPWVNVGSHSPRWISISAVDGNVVWTLDYANAVRVSTDDGGTWSAAMFPPFTTGVGTKIEAHPTDVATAIATYGSYGPGIAHMALTTDFGATWSDVTGDFVSQPVNGLVIDPAFPGHWYVGADVGVWRTTDGGATWLPFGTNLPNVVVSDLEIRRDYRKLVIGTFGRGVWEIDLAPDPVAAGESGPADLAVSRMMLDAPHPNPASAQATFRFAARASGAVSLRVYDVAGRMVSSLVEDGRGDGIVRAASWLTDDVPPGVYFAVLQADGRSRSRKVVVAR